MKIKKEDKKKNGKCKSRRLIVITEPMIHRAFHEIALEECKKWERGVGETLACGTAAAASLVASVLNGFTDRKTKVELPGGKLEVEWNRNNNTVWLSGPAEKVFEGQIRV